MSTTPLMNKTNVLDLLEKQDYTALRRLFKESEAADVAEICSDVSLVLSVRLFRLVSRTRRVEIFSRLELERQEDFVIELPRVLITSILNELDPDDRTKLLERLDEEIQDQLIAELNPEERLVASELLSYPESSVGRLMNPEVISFEAGMSVGDALKYIRWAKIISDEYLNNLFIVDEEKTLIGEVSLTVLVSTDPLTLPVSEIMRRSLVTLSPLDEEGQAVEMARKYDRSSYPVVDENKKLLGVVTSDDIFDVAEDEATEDIQQFGGQGALEDSYFQTPLLTMLQKRAGWLAVLFVGGFLSCAAIASYEVAFSKWAFLVLFLPIVGSSGGNSGTQAASLIIRGLAIKEMEQKDVWRVLSRELVTGVFLGLILALLGFLYSYTFDGQIGHYQWYHLGTAIALSVLCVVLLGVTVGSMLPFVFNRINLDPAVVSSPFISTIMDVMGNVIYFTIASFILTYFA